MRPGRPFIATIALAVVAMATGIAVQRYTAAPAELAAATAIEPARPVPEFTLDFGDGDSFDRAWLEGRHTLLFFGFANCPDICPLTLATLADAVSSVRASAGSAPDVVFVSVDPERDTPEAASAYAQFFDAGFRAATGDDDALSALTMPLGILFLDVPLEGGGYTVDHSTAILYIDPRARLAAVFGAPHNAESLARDIRQLLADA